MTDHVVFDFNGTLFFDEKYHYIAWGKMYEERFGGQLTRSDIEKMEGNNNKQIIKGINPNLSEEEVEYYARLKEEYYRKVCLAAPEGISLVKGAKTFFDELKEQEIPFTIASASIKENIDFFCDVFELWKWFDTEKIIYDDGSYLDKRQMFIDASKVLGKNIEQALIFEDSGNGIRWAREIQVGKLVGVGPEHKHGRLLADGADTVISDFSNIDITILN